MSLVRTWLNAQSASTKAERVNAYTMQQLNASGGSREGARGTGPPLFWIKKIRYHRRKKSRQGGQNKTTPTPTPLA